MTGPSDPTVAGIRVVPIPDAAMRQAVEPFARFGAGQGHPAQKTFGDGPS